MIRVNSGRPYGNACCMNTSTNVKRKPLTCPRPLRGNSKLHRSSHVLIYGVCTKTATNVQKFPSLSLSDSSKRQRPRAGGQSQRDRCSREEWQCYRYRTTTVLLRSKSNRPAPAPRSTGGFPPGYSLSMTSLLWPRRRCLPLGPVPTSPGGVSLVCNYLQKGSNRIQTATSNGIESQVPQRGGGQSRLLTW